MSITIALAGDTMLGRGVGAEIATAGPAGLFSDALRDVVGTADLAVANLECCISARGRPWDTPGKRFHFRAPPQAVEALAGLGIRCVTLANNHALDFGYAALADTVEYLSAAGIACAGAGADVERARAPAMLSIAGLTVAVVSVTDHPADFAATAGRAGVAYADLHGAVPGWLISRVRELAGQADVVLVMPHWGPNMTSRPLPYIRSAAQALTGAGATLVAGHSAHVFHGVAERVLYDLGDFIDDYATDRALRNDLGLLFLVTVGPGGPERVAAVPLKLQYAHTELAAGIDRDQIAARFTRACAALGTTVAQQDGFLVAGATA